MKEVIILAGGFGTRLKHVVNSIPKPLAPIADRPFIFYIIDQLLRFEYTHFIFSLGYKSEMLIEAVKAVYPNIGIDFCVENKPLMTGGAIRFSLDKVKTENVLIVNGDTYFDIPLNKLMDFHMENNSDVTLALKRMKNFDRYGVVNINKGNKIISFEEKKFKSEGLINAGYIYLKKGSLLNWEVNNPFSFEMDFLERKLNQLEIFGYPTNGYFIDIGVPDDYYRADRDFRAVNW